MNNVILLSVFFSPSLFFTLFVDLQEGTGPRVMSAFVEIIFDNTDNRIPVSHPLTLNWGISLLLLIKCIIDNSFNTTGVLPLN